MPRLRDDVGNRFLRFREALNVSQRDLGLMAKVSHAALGQIERGINSAITFEMLERMAHVFNIEPVDLFVFPWATENGLPWRHVAHEQIRKAKVTDLPRIVGLLEEFAPATVEEHAVAIRNAKR